MADLQTQIKADIAIIKADIASLHAKTADLKGWMATHMVVIVPVCLMIGWVLGRL